MFVVVVVSEHQKPFIKCVQFILVPSLRFRECQCVYEWTIVCCGNDIFQQVDTSLPTRRHPCVCRPKSAPQMPFSRVSSQFSIHSANGRMSHQFFRNVCVCVWMWQRIYFSARKKPNTLIFISNTKWMQIIVNITNVISRTLFLCVSSLCSWQQHGRNKNAEQQ